MAIYKLGEIGFFKGGISTLNKNKYDSGIHFVNYMDIFRNSYITNANKIRLYDATYKDIEKYNVQYGDALFTASSEKPDEIAMSSIYLSRKKAIFNGFSKRFRYDKNILIPKYASYLFRSSSFRKQAKSFASGYTRFNISQSDLSKIQLDIPSLTEQKEIIDIIEPIEKMIDCINDIIEKTNIIIKNMPASNYVKGNMLFDFIKFPPKGVNQISAKIIKKRNPLIGSYEPEGTYKTNSFYTPTGTILINTIRAYLEKFAIVNEGADSNGTLAHIKAKDHKFTSILSTLLNEDFWSQSKALSRGTKMPVLSKSDILYSINYKDTTNVIGLEYMYVYSSSLIIKLDKLREQIIKTLIK